MNKIPAVRFNSVEHAIRNGFYDMASIRLKDGSSLKIMSKDNRLDAFVVKNGKILSAYGSQGSSEFIDNRFVTLLIKMQKSMEKGKDIFDEFYKSMIKVENVK